MTEPTSQSVERTLGNDGNDGFSRAVVGGLVGAIVGGGLWALIVRITGYELGYVAWGIGGLVGFVMSRLTATRGSAPAMVAAAVAATGLLIGKGLIVSVGMDDSVTAEILEDPDWLAEIGAQELYSQEAFPDNIQEEIHALSINDTLPDALYTKMLFAGGAYTARLKPEEREAMARAHAASLLSNVALTDRLKASLSLWDLLWLGLAITTAHRSMAGPSEELDEATG